MTNRKLKRMVTTGDVIIDGYQADTWFISLTRNVNLNFKHMVAGRLYTILLIQTGDKLVNWPANVNAASLDPRKGSISVQTFFASDPATCQSISAMTYMEKP
jgi:hypothetical protein